MEQALVAVKHELGRGGALCKEFNRSRLSDNLNWKVEMHYALAAMETNPQLGRCDPNSVGRALIDLGVMGLTLSPAMKYAYMIPYRIKMPDGKFVDRATISPSYMGLEQMAYRTGYVEIIQCVLVRAGDKFEVYTDDLGRHIKHVENLQEQGGVTHAYCIAKFSSGKQHVEVMSKQELIACRDAAKRKNNGKVPFTWTGDFRGEMYKKCVLRRAWKHWPKVDNPRLVAMMDAVDRTDPMDFNTEAESVVEESQFIDGDQIDELVRMMADAGIPERGYDPWLAALAKSAAYPQGIRHVKKDDFERIKSAHHEGLVKWKAQQQPSPTTTSNSEPEGATSQREAG